MKRQLKQFIKDNTEFMPRIYDMQGKNFKSPSPIPMNHCRRICKRMDEILKVNPKLTTFEQQRVAAALVIKQYQLKVITPALERIKALKGKVEETPVVETVEVDESAEK